MSNLLRRLNDLPVFDVSRWPAREAIGRVVGCVTVAAFIARRILQLPNSPGYISEVRWTRPFFDKFSKLPQFLVVPAFDMEKAYTGLGYSRDQIHLLWGLMFLLWVIATGIFLGYLIAFLTRARAQSVAKGFMQTVFPVILAVLPYVTVMTSYTYRDWFPERTKMHMTGLYAILALLIAGGLLNLIGILGLRRGFTIMSEARVFIRSGIYRWIRHPLYASHFIMNICYTLLYFHVTTVALYIVFVAGQTLRARIEERKLTSAFPEYEEYRRSTGMFFPRLWGGGPEARSQS
jgi:protein-S-isoprenylcysteine O-methyltransferase Ste14